MQFFPTGFTTNLDLHKQENHWLMFLDKFIRLKMGEEWFHVMEKKLQNLKDE